MDYVQFNPMKHGLVKRIADWPFLTFHRLVKQGVYSAPLHLAVMPEQRDLFLNQVADRYVEQHPLDANGQFLIRAKRLLVLAHRPAAA